MLAEVARARLPPHASTAKERRCGARRRLMLRAARREAAKWVAFQKEFDARRATVRELAADFPDGQRVVVPFSTSRPLAPWERRGPRPESRMVARRDVRLPGSRRARIALVAMRAGGERSARICARRWGSEFAFRWDPRWGYDDGG